MTRENLALGLWLKVGAGLLAAAVMVTPAAAQQDGEGQPPPDLVGAWEISGQADAVWVFNEDGTATTSMADQQQPVEWQVEPVSSPLRLYLTDAAGTTDLLLLDAADPDRLRVLLTGRLSDDGEPDLQRVDAPDIVLVREVAAEEDSAAVAAPPDIYERLALDLTTPESAAATFIDAVARYDGLLVYFLLDPLSRDEVRTWMMLWRPQRFVSEELSDEQAADIMQMDLLSVIRDDAIDPFRNLGFVGVLPYVEAIFRYAAERGWRTAPLPDNSEITRTVVVAQENGRTVAHVLVTGDGPQAAIHLVLSPSGYWRVLGVSQDGGGSEPEVWLRSETR